MLAQVLHRLELILRFARATLDFARDSEATGLPVLNASFIAEFFAALFTPELNRVKRLLDKPV